MAIEQKNVNQNIRNSFSDEYWDRTVQEATGLNKVAIRFMDLLDRARVPEVALLAGFGGVMLALTVPSILAVAGGALGVAAFGGFLYARTITRIGTRKALDRDIDNGILVNRYAAEVMPAKHAEMLATVSQEAEIISGLQQKFGKAAAPVAVVPAEAVVVSAPELKS